jgi:Zn-dependent protease
MSASFQTATACPECGRALAPTSLSCENCGWLRHAAQLEDLARRAKLATDASHFAAACALWEEMLPLLPPNTAQYQAVRTRIADLAALMQTPGARRSVWKKGAAGAGPALLLLLSKGKLLLLGLTKISTLLSMFAFFGVYWAMFGWAFALGFVLAIYIHEMGHVILLRRYGIPASAPLFIPGLGAMIGVSGAILDPVQDSRVGLAGPLYGLGAASFAFLAAPLTGWATLGAIAYSTAVINLFNLVPVWQLDGARGLHSLTRWQRAILLAIALGMFAITSERMLLIVAAGLAYRLFTRDQAEYPDQTGLMQFAFLLVALPGLAMLASRAFPAVR